MKQFLFTALLWIAFFNTANAQQLKSPNEKFVMTFSLQNDGTPSYSLNYKGKAVVKPSKLGLELKNASHNKAVKRNCFIF